VEDESRPLEDLAEDVLEGRSVDWRSAESSVDPGRRDAVEQLKVLAGIAGIHRALASEAAEPLESWGRLKVLERIGQGSFGDVYRAWDTKLDREVALKLLRADAAPERGAEFLKEARLLARVRHPNIAIVYDADEIEGRVGLWMEFIHGKNLEEILRETKVLDEREVTRIGIDLCRALAAVHSAGLLHRDVKTQNVMRHDDGRLVLMDFGTGSDLESTSGATDAAGTPLYLAPEIFEGLAATVRSDIYSAGVLLFHLLTGSYPVKGENLDAVADAHRQPGGRADRVSGASRVLSAVVARAIDPTASRRYASANEMLSALESVERRARAPRRAALLAAGFALAALLVGATAFLTRSDAPHPALPSFKARDSLLVSSFENRTGEKDFDGTLDYALSLDLANSRYVRVASRERVRDVLRLMKKDPDTRIDPSLARDVCLRDGNIRALVTGRVESAGSAYVLIVQLADPRRGNTVATFEEKSNGAGGSLAAVQRISNRIRSTLGETPTDAETEGPGLARVTTSSLKALQLYSRADSLMTNPGYNGEGLAEADGLLRQAVAEDPSFASAWIHLAFRLINEGSNEEGLTCAETAMSLADSASERERYFIKGSYYLMHDQKPQAIAAYETLLDLDPDHFWAANNIIHIYDFSKPNEFEKAIQLEARIADSRPFDFYWNSEAAYTAAIQPNPVRFDRFRSRATALITPEARKRFPEQVAWLELQPFIDEWQAGAIDLANERLDTIAGQVDSRDGPARDSLAASVALGYMTLGRFDAAAQMTERIANASFQSVLLAQVAFLRGKDTEVLRRLNSQSYERGTDADPFWWHVLESNWDAILLLQARLGLVGTADNLSQRMQQQDARPELRSAAQGELALAQRQSPNAIRHLTDSLKIAGTGPYEPPYFLAREALAMALVKSGSLSRAIEALEDQSGTPQAVENGSTGAYWLRNRLQLARLYRKAGRTDEAIAIEAELRRFLAFADSDHPILVELNRPRT
jgi:serine/threonine protein kinase